MKSFTSTHGHLCVSGFYNALFTHTHTITQFLSTSFHRCLSHSRVCIKNHSIKRHHWFWRGKGATSANSSSIKSQSHPSNQSPPPTVPCHYVPPRRAAPSCQPPPGFQVPAQYHVSCRNTSMPKKNWDLEAISWGLYLSGDVVEKSMHKQLNKGWDKASESRVIKWLFSKIHRVGRWMCHCCFYLSPRSFFFAFFFMQNITFKETSL